jgi:hypothetical protein
MDRLSMGEKIAGASAVLLFLFMFFDWFSVDVSGGSGGFVATASTSGSAWDALDNIPIFLLITIVVTLGVVGLRFVESAFEPAVPLGAVVAVLGAISVLLILYRIIDPPGSESVPGLSIDVSPSLGIFLALIAAGGVTYGGYRAMQEEGASFGDTADRLSGGGGSGGPGGPADPGTGGYGGAPGPGAAAPPPPPPPQTPPPPPPSQPPPPAS